MRLTVKIEFNSEDNTDAEVVLTQADLALPEEELLALAQPALLVVFRNAKRYDTKTCMQPNPFAPTPVHLATYQDHTLHHSAPQSKPVTHD